MSRLARLSAANGGKTRAIVKLFGRGAIMLAASALDLALWMFWAALALARILRVLQARAEGLTLRHLHRRKLRRARAELAALAAPSLAYPFDQRAAGFGGPNAWSPGMRVRI